MADSAKKAPSFGKPAMETIVIPPARGAHTASVLWLHGLGDSALGFADLMRSADLPGVKWILPTAPVRPVSINGGFPSTAWFDIVGLSPGTREDVEGMDAAYEFVRNILLSEQEAGIPSSKIFIGGFSMGGALSLYTTLKAVCGDEENFNVPLGGCLALSAWLPVHSQWVAPKLKQRERHTIDDVELLSRGQPSKSKVGSRQTPHRLTEQERKDFEIAKKNGYVVFRQASRINLGNIWYKWCEAKDMPYVTVDLDNPTDSVRVDLTSTTLWEEGFLRNVDLKSMWDDARRDSLSEDAGNGEAPQQEQSAVAPDLSASSSSASASASPSVSNGTDSGESSLQVARASNGILEISGVQRSSSKQLAAALLKETTRVIHEEASSVSRTRGKLERDIPVLMCNGQEDQLVIPMFGEISATSCRRLGLSDVTLKMYPGLGHSVSPEEMHDVKQWLLARL